jgi:hypothetical protein
LESVATIVDLLTKVKPQIEEMQDFLKAAKKGTTDQATAMEFFAPA